jgi:hypothetical protein
MNLLRLWLLPMNYCGEQAQCRRGQKLAWGMVIYSSMRNLLFALVAQ